jgi:hypothetical protein
MKNVLLWVLFLVCSNCVAQEVYSKKVPNFELAKLIYYITDFDSTQIYLKDKFGENRKLKIQSACIAPALTSFEGCGCSDFLYVSIANGMHSDIPDKFDLYKIGPFFQPKLVSSKNSKGKVLLKIEFGHDVVQRKTLTISSDGVMLK